MMPGRRQSRALGSMLPHDVVMARLFHRGEVERATCPCCGYRTLPESGAYEVCPVCLWEDDGFVSTEEPDVWRGGPNGISLVEGQRNFARYGAAHPENAGEVRPPRRNEPRDPGWRPHNPDL